jgi:hypothetical protein
LREAVTEEGSPEDGTAKYPVVRVVSALCGAIEPTEAVEASAERVNTILGMPEDLATALLKTTRTEAMVLAQSLA